MYGLLREGFGLPQTPSLSSAEAFESESSPFLTFFFKTELTQRPAHNPSVVLGVSPQGIVCPLYVEVLFPSPPLPSLTAEMKAGASFFPPRPFFPCLIPATSAHERSNKVGIVLSRRSLSFARPESRNSVTLSLSGLLSQYPAPDIAPSAPPHDDAGFF